MVQKIRHALLCYASPACILFIVIKCTKDYSSNYMINEEPDKIIDFPSSIEDVKVLAHVSEKVYIPQHFEFLITVFSVGYLYVQILSKPGALYLTLLSPHLFDYMPAVMICTTLQTIGSCGSYLISSCLWTPILKAIITSDIATFLSEARGLVQSQNRFNVGRFLTAARLCPLIPNFLINFFAPQIDIPFWVFLFSTFFGSVPYISFIVFVGTKIKEFSSLLDILSNSTVLWLYIDLVLTAALIALPYSFFMNYGRRERINPARRDRRKRRDRKSR